MQQDGVSAAVQADVVCRCSVECEMRGSFFQELFNEASERLFLVRVRFCFNEINDLKQMKKKKRRNRWKRLFL